MANYDENTGIHYGAISQHSVLQAWADSAEAVYPPPVCPVCSGSVKNLEEGQDPEIVDAEYYCANCDQFHTAEDCLPEEPGGYQYIGEGYEATSILDTDILLVKSPYYTLARPCSPAYPTPGTWTAQKRDISKPTVSVRIGLKTIKPRIQFMMFRYWSIPPRTDPGHGTPLR